MLYYFKNDLAEKILKVVPAVLSTGGNGGDNSLHVSTQLGKNIIAMPYVVNTIIVNNNKNNNKNYQLCLRFANIGQNINNFPNKLTYDVNKLTNSINKLTDEFDKLINMFKIINLKLDNISKDIKALKAFRWWSLGFIAVITFVFFAVLTSQFNKINRTLQEHIKSIDNIFKEQNQKFEDGINAQNQKFEDRFNAQNQKFEDRFNAQNQIDNEKFSSLMKENDRTYQLALEALKRVSVPVPSQPELSTNPSPPGIGSPPDANMSAPGGEIR